MESFEVTERLCLTEDDRVVGEDHPEARWLWKIPGEHVSIEEAQARGLIVAAVEEPASEESVDQMAAAEEPAQPAGDVAAAKAKAKPADKAKRKASTKDA